MLSELLRLLDALLHLALDGYINRQWLGWGLLQLGQWHVCQAYENRVQEGADRSAPE